MAKINIYVADKQKAAMKNYPHISWSEVAAKAFAEAMDKDTRNRILMLSKQLKDFLADKEVIDEKKALVEKELQELMNKEDFVDD